MDRIKNCAQAYLPGLPKSDLVQLAIFLALFNLTCSVLLGNWPGVSFLLNNGAILLICFFTIALPPNTRIFYLFSTTLPASAFIDIMSITFNWSISYKAYPGFLFFFSFFMTLILVVVKILVAIHQFEIAKNLNSETSPISIEALKTSFVNAVTLQQTPIGEKQQPAQGVDIEAPGPVEELQAPAVAAEEQREVTVVEVTPASPKKE